MSKLNYENRKTRSQNSSLAIAHTPVEVIGNHGLANLGVPNGVASSRTVIPTGVASNRAGRLGPNDKLPAFPIGNRIQFANPTDLALPNAANKAVSAGRKPAIAFARQLAEAPARLPATASDPSLSARAHRLFLRIIHRVSKQLLQRHGRRKLQLLEIQQLGEKRFVAIVRVGKQRFLIGGAATSVSLLAEIDSHKTTVIASRPLDQETA